MIAEPERADLLGFLAAQRESVLAIVAGLDETALRRPVTPSGWTPLGMIEHLAHAERFWFQHVLTGQMSDLPWQQSDEDEEPFVSPHPTEAVMAFYRDTCALSDAMLAGTPLTTKPVGSVSAGLVELARDARTIVLHMIEETARHAGHLDIGRELIDGRTGLGAR